MQIAFTSKTINEKETSILLLSVLQGFLVNVFKKWCFVTFQGQLTNELHRTDATLLPCAGHVITPVEPTSSDTVGEGSLLPEPNKDFKRAQN